MTSTIQRTTSLCDLIKEKTYLKNSVHLSHGYEMNEWKHIGEKIRELNSLYTKINGSIIEVSELYYFSLSWSWFTDLCGFIIATVLKLD